jgi:glycosyltransferase involved in cell wall biosynthesis
VTACSIVIPTYNRPELLPRAVASALLACPLDGEVVVVDDRSPIPAKQILNTVTDTRLRVIRNSGPGGAALVRNLGVASALGEVVFFLDDDDQMVEDYCRRILLLDGSAGQARWGFSSTLVRQGEACDSDRLFERRRLRHGLVADSSRVRDRVCAMSEGFWISKQTFLDCGGLDSEQFIDEDTDLCIRLMGIGIAPWYEEVPGMVVYRGYAPSVGSAGQLTMTTPVARGLRCYRRTFDKNEASFPPLSAARWFLASRFIRRAVKQREYEVANEFVRALRPSLLRLCATAFLALKRLVHATPHRRDGR